MIDKKEFFLEQIIKAYIANLGPIGSSQLKNMYDIDYSSATIRGYFKKLGDEGFLEQVHASSGRTPTIEALRQHWKNRLKNDLGAVSFKKLEYFAQEVGLSVFIKKKTSDVLENIATMEQKYIVLEFSTFAIILKYSSALYRFLGELIGFEISHILNISKQVGASELYEKLDDFLQKKDFSVFNTKEFLSLCINYDLGDDFVKLFLNGEILNNCEQGLYFERLLPSEYMGVCHNCFVDDVYSKVFVLGELNKDYEYFYKQIAA